MTDAVALPAQDLAEGIFRVASHASGSITLSVDICTDPSILSDDWRALEQVGLGTLFQSYAWISAWCRHAAAHFSEEPIIVTGRDGRGEIAFVLPFAAKTVLGQKFLTWLGQDHAGYGFGLYRRDVVKYLDKATIQNVLDHVRAVRPDIAGLHLTKQPIHWDGIENPFLQLPSQPMSLEVTAFSLAADFNAWYSSSFSSKMRRNMRRRLEKLNEIDSVEFSLASDGQQRIDAFSVFQAQKTAQLERAQEQSPFDNPAIQSFYRDFLGSREDGTRHLTGILRVGETVAAVELCVGFQDRVYALNRSMTDGDLRQYSLGWQLNTWLVQRSCCEGYKVYDLGPGSSEYKEVFKNHKIPCFSTIVALRSAAIPLTASMRLLARGKHSIASYLNNNPAFRLRLEFWYNKLRCYTDRILPRGV